MEKDILISIGDERIKEISEVLSNKTCNRILDFLIENEASVGDISQKLGIPINTADYNVKKLVKAGLIEKTSHWWSVKGKKIPVYKISNKKIIISPKKKIGRSFGLAFIITGFSALLIRGYYAQREILVKTSRETLDTLKEPVFSSAQKTAEIIPSIPHQWSWFLAGAWFAILVFFIITIISEKKS